MEEGADFILGETYQQLEEALLATKCVKEYGKGKNIFMILKTISGSKFVLMTSLCQKRYQ